MNNRSIFKEIRKKYGYINSLALSFQVLAVKPIVQASSIIALGVAFAIIKVAPALQRGRAVLPRVVEVEGAVAVVPTALMVVTKGIAKLVVFGGFTLRDLTFDLHL